MIMKKFNILLICALTAASLVSCDSNLLDIPQQGVRSEGNSYITDDDCDAALAAAYARFRSIYAGGFTIYGQKNGGDGTGRKQENPYEVNGIWFKDMLGDDQHTVAGEDTDYLEIESSAISSTNSWVNVYYKNMYETIYLANLVITKFDPTESAVKSRNVAEARVIRAFCYYELTTLWGPVPKVDRILATSQDFQIGNCPEEELWDFIEEDLTTALSCPDLTSKKTLGDIDGAARITTQAARMLLAKTYLWQKKYHEAREVLEPVITSGLYKLEEDVAVFYHSTGNGSQEYIWEFVRHTDFSNPTYQYGWYGIDANWLFGCGMSGGPECRNYYEFNHESYGWGFMWPTKSLYDAFLQEEGENGWRLSRTIKNVEQVIAMCIGFTYDLNLQNMEGLFRMKWLPTLSDEPQMSKYYGIMCNTPVFRYGDALLMMAEACLNDGAAGEAETYFNMIRTRAHLSEKHGITMDDIKLERRLELAMEGQRYQDLKRWGDISTVLKNKGETIAEWHAKVDSNNDLSTAEGYYNAKYTFTQEYHPNKLANWGWQDELDWYLPFPETEILVNRALMEQNAFNASIGYNHK